MRDGNERGGNEDEPSEGLSDMLLRATSEATGIPFEKLKADYARFKADVEQYGSKEAERRQEARSAAAQTPEAFEFHERLSSELAAQWRALKALVESARKQAERLEVAKLQAKAAHAALGEQFQEAFSQIAGYPLFQVIEKGDAVYLCAGETAHAELRVAEPEPTPLPEGGLSPADLDRLLKGYL